MAASRPAASPPYRFRLHVDGLAVEIDCDTTELCERLRDSLTLAYAPDSVQSADSELIRVWVTSRAVSGCRPAGAGLAAQSPVWLTFPLLGHRGQPISRVARATGEGLAISRDLETGTWYLTDREMAAAHLIRNRSPRFAGEVRRYLRGLVTAYLRSHGYLLLHAAAVRLGDLAVLAVGERGAGKTTLALTLVEAFGAALASNDTVLFRPAIRGVELQGRDGRLRVRPGSLLTFPSLASHAPAGLRLRSAAAVWQSDEKVSFGPAALKALFRTARLDGVTRVAVLFPYFDPAGEASVQRLSPTEGVELLRAQVLPDSGPRAPWLDLQFRPVEAELVAARLAAELPRNPAINWYRVGTGSAPLSQLAPCLAKHVPELAARR